MKNSQNRVIVRARCLIPQTSKSRSERSEDLDNDYLSLMVNKFKKFFKKKNISMHFSQKKMFKKNEQNLATYTCFKCEIAKAKQNYHTFLGRIKMIQAHLENQKMNKKPTYV
ncbi:hypothetical protein CR513_03452, partial [Mucuna pruriens]